MTLTVTDLVQNRLYQRDLDGDGRPLTYATLPIVFTGAVGAPVTVEARVLAYPGATVHMDWTTVTGSAPAGGAFSGTVQVPQMTKYAASVSSRGLRLEVRCKDIGGTPTEAAWTGTNYWSVGRKVAACGSSTIAGAFGANTGDDPTATWPTDSVCSIFSATPGGFTSWSAGVSGMVAMNMAELLMDDEDVATGFVAWGVASTFLDDGVGNGWRYGMSYAQYVVFDTALGVSINGDKVECCVIHVGSNDARSGGVSTAEDHLDKYKQLIAAVRTSTGQPNLRFLISGCARSLTGAGVAEAGFQKARAAEFMLTRPENDPAGFGHGLITTIDLPIGGDNVHIEESEEGQIQLGKRWGRAYLGHVKGDAVDWKGPKPQEFCAYNSVTGAMLATFDLPLGSTSLTGAYSNEDPIDGVMVFNNGTLIAGTTASILSASELLITGVGTGLDSQELEVIVFPRANPIDPLTDNYLCCDAELPV